MEVPGLPRKVGERGEGRTCGVGTGGLTCPLGPGSPDSPCRHKEPRSRSGGGPRGQPPLPALPQVARSPSRLSLQGGRPPPGHPAERTTCQTRGGGGGDAEQGWGWLGIGALGLTTPPRGPVFPGEPWRKRGVRGLASYPLHGVPHLTFCHTPLSNSASPTRPEPCDLQVWRLRKDLRPADPTSPVLGPLSQVFPSPIWYLVSFDARQALGPWNSRGALLPLRALRRKETKGINGVGGLDMMPCPPQLACTHLPSLRARLPHWTPLALVTLKWKEKVTHSAALSRCSLSHPGLTRHGQGALHFCCHWQGVLCSTWQTSKGNFPRPCLGRPLTGWAAWSRCCI